jgi:hypothetical protein
MPKPGPAPHMMADPLPLLTFTPQSSLATLADLTAVSTPPGQAGPCPTNPTTPMQDFGQRMGMTALGPPDTDQIGDSGADDN